MRPGSVVENCENEILYNQEYCTFLLRELRLNINLQINIGTILWTSWHFLSLSSKNLVLKVALIPENRARRAQIEKIRSLLLCNIPPIIYKKWSYFFDFSPLGLRNGNKGQN